MQSLNNFQKWVLRRPLLSTTLTAFYLALLWTIIWFLVLLVLTYATNTSTAADVLVGGLLLSTVAESIVRVLETGKISQMFSNGNVAPKNNEKSFGWALAFLFAGMFCVMIFDDSFSFPEKGEFLLASQENGGIFVMVPMWVQQFSSSWTMVISLSVCVILRTIIYKKCHKTVEWQSTVNNI